MVATYFNTGEILNISNLSHDKRFYAAVTVLGQSFFGLLDSGATISVVSQSFYRKLLLLGLKSHEVTCQNLVTADGTSHSVQSVVHVPLQFNKEFKVVPFFVMEKLNHEIILGMTFFHAFDLSVELKKGSESNIIVQGDQQLLIIDTVSPIVGRSELSLEEETKLQTLIQDMAESIGIGLGRTHLIQHRIDTADHLPVKQRQYPFAPPIMRELEEEIQQMLEDDVIEPSYSPWRSPVLLVEKSSGKKRLCLDSRQLNKVTKKDSYPLPRVSSVLDNLKNARYLSTVDLKSAFWQIPLEDSSKEKTAFGLSGKGLYQFKVMPFGLSNAAQTQQRLMDRLFPSEYEGKIFTYLDDIVIVNADFEDHLSSLRWVKEQLSMAGLSINMEKCEFGRPSLKYLGYIVDKEGLRTDPDKVSAILNYPRPSTFTELKRFIGLASWYRRFVDNFAIVAAPLHDLTKGGRKGKLIDWNEEAEIAFVDLKTALTTTPILCVPDYTKEFSVQCDASNKGVGAVLFQTINGSEKPVAYTSRKLSERESKYTTSERELLSVLHAVEQFRPYVEGSHFKIYTDNSSLLWLQKQKDPHGRLARWAMRLQQFDYELLHRKGKENVVPDVLSRAIPDFEIDVLDIRQEDKDEWYLDQEDKVRKGLETSDWELSQNKLWKFLKLKQFPDETYDWKLVVPKSMREAALKECHDDPVSGHLGIKKSVLRTRQHYFWPSLIKDVKDHVRKCEICASHKVSQQPASGLMGKHREVTQPFQIVSLDLMGPFPRSTQGNTMLLVISCWFSKFCLLFPLRNGKASNITKIIEEQVLLLFGIPKVIICDNGKQFVSGQFKELAQNYGIDIWYTPSYHPQANPTERVNRVIGTAIASYVNDNHKHWDKYIPHIAHAIRTAVHEVTGKTPSYLFLGRETSVHGSKPSSFNVNDALLFDRDVYTENQRLRNEIFEDVSKRLKDAYEASKTRYDLRRRICNYSVGEIVWKRSKLLSNADKQFMAKLAPKFEKAIIVAKISSDVYQLKSLRGKDLGNWHSSDLKRL